MAKYDRHLQDYQTSSVKIATSLAYLNSGQNMIFSTALTAIMFLAAQGVVKGEAILDYGWKSSHMIGLQER